jgi:hypothetical protein
VTFVALMVTAIDEADDEDVPAGWVCPELALVAEDEDPHAATAAAAPRARLPYSSRKAGTCPERWIAIFTETPFSGSSWLRCFPVATGKPS